MFTKMPLRLAGGFRFRFNDAEVRSEGTAYHYLGLSMPGHSGVTQQRKGKFSSIY